MSCYEWESGTLTLPARDYAAFRKDIIQAWNSRQLNLLAAAAAALPALRSACARKSGWEANDAAHKVAAAHWKEPHELLSLVMKTDAGKPVFRSPKKKDIDLKPVSRGCILFFEDAAISFGDEARSVVWSVEENNHAREHSRAHPIAKHFFAQLARINWVRGTGGVIIGNDEYNRDADHEGGGGNYVTSRYGPLGSERMR